MFIRNCALWALIALTLIATGCRGSALLLAVSLSSDRLSPNGDGVANEIFIDYSLARDSAVSIYFLDQQGKEYRFRNREPRSAGQFRARFDGTYAPQEDSEERRVMPQGSYTYVVLAEDARGTRDVRQGQIHIDAADTELPQIQELVVFPERISPNGDGEDDEAEISYKLSKPATVEIFVTDDQGNRFLLEAPNKKGAAFYSHRWNGTSGGKPLADGNYTLHLRASDGSGNVVEQRKAVAIEEAGTPRLEITEVRFSPPAIPRGGLLKVEIRVKNVGNTYLRTLGPSPGTPYTTQMSYNSFKDASDPNGPPLYYERAGYWRVGVGWNLADRPIPVRWGLTRDLTPLAPGQEATITGTLQVLIDQTREVYFWASTVQEGVGFPSGQVGIQRVLVSY